MPSFAHRTLPFFFGKGSLWRCWQASTERWFVFASGQAVFEEDSHSSSKSSAALLLEMEQHTILSSVNLSSVLTPTCLSSPLLLLLASVHSSTLLLYRLICQCALLAKPSVGAEAPRSLTDGETMTAALSRSPVAVQPQHPHCWGDKRFNESL